MSAADSEVWRAVPGFPGYEVSNLGRVLSHLRGAPRLMCTPLNTGGYPNVHLVGPEGRKSRPVHALVASAFLGPRPAGYQIRHLDGERTHNYPSNLAYGTVLENHEDTLRHGKHVQAARTHCPRQHPYDEANTLRRSDGRRRCRICTTALSRAAYERRIMRAANVPLGAGSVAA